MDTKKFTLTEVKEMGFSDKLIAQLLPEPELKCNPYYKCAPKMKLWKEEDVKEAMQSEVFIAFVAKRQKRQAAARKAVETKTNNLIKQVQSAAEEIKITVMDMDKLARVTIQAKQEWYDYLYERNMDYGWYDTECQYADGADEDTVKRWMVNYIRHNMTSYDRYLYELAKKTGKQEAYLYLFKAILQKIGEAYPELKDECLMQIENKEIEIALAS